MDKDKVRIVRTLLNKEEDTMKKRTTMEWVSDTFWFITGVAAVFMGVCLSIGFYNALFN